MILCIPRHWPAHARRFRRRKAISRLPTIRPCSILSPGGSALTANNAAGALTAGSGYRCTTCDPSADKTVDEYAVDTGLLHELREYAKQAAQERHHKDDSDYHGELADWADEELYALDEPPLGT